VLSKGREHKTSKKRGGAVWGRGKALVGKKITTLQSNMRGGKKGRGERSQDRGNKKLKGDVAPVKRFTPENAKDIQRIGRLKGEKKGK